MRTSFGCALRRVDTAAGYVARLSAFLVAGSVLASGCAHLPPVIETDPQTAVADSTMTLDKGSQKKIPPRCYGYVLLVENGHSQPVEIYEVGNLTPRFVAVALIGITEVPMTSRTQQFVAMSSGEVMAASSSNMERPSDRVALQRSCRLFQ